jgi:hypothetical protein
MFSTSRAHGDRCVPMQLARRWQLNPHLRLVRKLRYFAVLGVCACNGGEPDVSRFATIRSAAPASAPASSRSVALSQPHPEVRAKRYPSGRWWLVPFHGLDRVVLWFLIVTFEAARAKSPSHSSTPAGVVGTQTEEPKEQIQ